MGAAETKETAYLVKLCVMCRQMQIRDPDIILALDPRFEVCV